MTARIRRRSESIPAIEAPVEPEPAATPVEMPTADVATPARHEEPHRVAVIHPFPRADACTRPAAACLPPAGRPEPAAE